MKVTVPSTRPYTLKELVGASNNMATEVVLILPASNADSILFEYVANGSPDIPLAAGSSSTIPLVSLGDVHVRANSGTLDLFLAISRV